MGETFFCFTPSFLPGFDLQETAVSWQTQAIFGANHTNNCLQWGLWRWELLIFGVKWHHFFPRHAFPAVHQQFRVQCQRLVGPASWGRGREIYSTGLLLSQFPSFFPAAIVDKAAATRREKGSIQWPEAKSIKALNLLDSVFSFCFVPVPCWLFFMGGFSNCRGWVAVLFFSLYSHSLHMWSGEGGLSAILPLSLRPWSYLQRAPFWGKGFLRHFVFFVPGESVGLSTFVSRDYYFYFACCCFIFW